MWHDGFEPLAPGLRTHPGGGSSWPEGVQGGGPGLLRGPAVGKGAAEGPTPPRWFHGPVVRGWAKGTRMARGCMVSGWQNGTRMYADGTRMVRGCMRMVRGWYADGTRMGKTARGWHADGTRMVRRWAKWHADGTRMVRQSCKICDNCDFIIFPTKCVFLLIRVPSAYHLCGNIHTQCHIYIYYI